MKLFLITSDKFRGSAEITYNAAGVLCRIDCSQTDMTELTVEHFKRAVPPSLQRLEAGGSFSQGTVVVASDFQVSFDQFYKAYPLKRNRFRVEKAWNKMDQNEQVKAYFSIVDYQKYLHKENWQKPMIADRYLTDKEYQTEWAKL